MLNFFDPFVGGGTSGGGSGTPGKDGNGIVSIKKTGSEGLKDIYTILYTNGTTTTYEVTNGADGTNGRDGVDGKDGKDGTNGTDGTNGKSAYEIAKDNGFVGSEDDWLDSLKGEKGDNGSNGANGLNGKEIVLRVTSTTIQWKYDTDTEWIDLIALSSLKGKDGKDGINGTNGKDGTDGANGKEIELRNDSTYIQWHYVGDESWYNLIEISSLKGADGKNGKSAYELAKDTGYTDTLEKWLESLKGSNGRGIESITWKNSTGGLSAGIEGAKDTYEILYDDKTTSTFVVQNGSKGSTGDTGISITGASLNDKGELILSFSDDTTKNVGKVKGEDGTSVKIKASKEECTEAGDGYIDDNGHLQVKNDSGTFTDAGEIKGPAGRGIKSVTINSEGHLLIIYSDSDEAVDVGLVKGSDGKSAYELAKDKGFDGTEEDWLSSLKGKDGRSILDVQWKSSTKGNESAIAGAKDTYEISYSDDTKTTFDVTNGTDISNVTVALALMNSNWTDNTITIKNNDIKENSIVLIGLQKGVNKEIYETTAKASISVKEQTDGQIVLQSFGTVPTIDIPIVLSIGYVANRVYDSFVVLDEESNEYTLGIANNDLYFKKKEVE